MKLTLNIHGSLARLYMEFYNTSDLPNNLCAYFWKLVVAIIFSIPCYPAMIINALTSKIEWSKAFKRYYVDSSRMNVVFGLFFNFIFLMIGILITGKIYGGRYLRYMAIWKIYLNGIMYSVLIGGGIIGIIALVILVMKNRDKNEKSYVDMTPEERTTLWDEQEKKRLRKEGSFWNLTKKAFMAWKEKNCPILEWNSNK